MSKWTILKVVISLSRLLRNYIYCFYHDLLPVLTAGKVECILYSRLFRCSFLPLKIECVIVGFEQEAILSWMSMMQTELEQHGGVLRWQSTLTSGTARRAASCIVLLKVVESRSQCLWRCRFIWIYLWKWKLKLTIIVVVTQSSLTRFFFLH